MSLYKFGTGVLYGVNTAANSTPIKFGALQDVAIDLTFTEKELYGQSQFPLAVARGTGKVTGKAKFAQINGLTYNGLFFGQTLTAGQVVGVDAEAATVPASTPFTVTVSNAATFKADWGVTDSATGLPLTLVASTPATGEYSVSNAGVYTFAAEDTGKAVSIAYSYTIAASGHTLNVQNQLQGVSPFFTARFNTTYNNVQYYLQLQRCMASKLSIPSKMADWNIEEMDFSCFADASGLVATIGLAE